MLVIRILLAAAALSAGIPAADAGSNERSVMVETALNDGDQPVALELVVIAPEGPGPFPLVLFNHGSTGAGDQPELFARTYVTHAGADFFTKRGYVVVFPQRRGRGRSGGLYDEGFVPDRSRYSCASTTVGPAVARALDDIGEALVAARKLPEVSKDPALLAGHSRGGLLALLFAARNPHGIGGVINFSGGWLGTACPDFAAINRSLFREAADWHGPTLFLYADRDPFYPLKSSRANFADFINEGGNGEFARRSLPRGINGHWLVDYPSVWSAPVDDFLLRNAP